MNEQAFDLDEVLDAVQPWRLPIKSDGRIYQTRRPSIGELAVMREAAAAQQLPDPSKLSKLFVGEPPPMDGWSTERLLAFVLAYITYFNAFAKKKAAKTLERSVLDALAPMLSSPSPP